VLPLPAGCSSGPKFVTSTEVASQVMAKAWGPTGTKPESATCPHDLQPTVGAAMKCTMTLEGRSLDVEVTVVEIEDGNVKLDMVAVGPQQTTPRSGEPN
jgi:hypothetical protein